MNKLDKKIIVLASILAAITIGVGAFGAHGLKELISSEALITFETGVRYQMYHVIALFVIGSTPYVNASTKKWSALFLLIGIILFSGSIYVLALKELWSFSVSFLGPVTPIGGLFFVLGWLRLAYGVINKR